MYGFSKYCTDVHFYNKDVILGNNNEFYSIRTLRVFISSLIFDSALARDRLRLMIALYCFAFTKTGPPPSLSVLNGTIIRCP